MNKIKYLAISSLVLIISCTTPYQKQTWHSFRGGYSEKKLSDNSFSITFNGNGWTNSNKISDFALRRSAEVTLENDFNYFVISQNDSDQVRKAAYGSGLVGIVVGQAIPKPTTNLIIFCYKERPKTTEKVYDAEKIAKNIKDRYKDLF